jgi:hypothetical protein
VTFKSTALGLLIYLIAEPPDFTVAFSEAESRAQYVFVAYFFSIALATISTFVAPAFIVPVAVYILSTRYLGQSISGLPPDMLDIRYMIDMALYLGLFAIPTVAIGPRIHTFFDDQARQNELTCVAFGLHLGNYFWSAVAKLLVGPHFFTWVFDNRTFNSIPWAIEYGISPIGHMPMVVNLVASALHAFVVPLNLSIVVFQLFAVICIFRLTWLKVASVFYDFLHLGIWLFSGLFFWPWVWNNITILLAARAAHSPLGLTAKLACVLTVLLGYPGLPFQKAAWLGWFDVLDARDAYIEAIAKDGRAARVPGAFFLGHEYSQAAAYWDTVPHEDQYEHSWGGSVFSYDRQLTSGSCPLPPPVAKERLETPEQRTWRLDQLSHFIQAHHAKMVAREQTFGKWSYYFRLNHHLSNPWLFRDFSALNLSDIVAYNAVMESICVSLVEGQLRKKIVGRIAETSHVR